MKKFIALILAGLMVFALAACGQQTSQETGGSATEAAVSGGWAVQSSPVVTEEVKAAFDLLNAPTTGETYTPVAYLEMQVVGGFNYRVLCKETLSDADATTTYAIVTLYSDPQQNVELTEVLNCSAEEKPAGLMGGWEEPKTPEVTDEAKSALEKATDTLTGATYSPVALLGTQVVSGTNYSILCRATPSTADGTPYYVIVTVYEDLQGNAQITDTYEFTAGTAAAAADAQSASSQAE